MAIIMNEARHFVFFPACWQAEGAGLIPDRDNVEIKMLGTVSYLGRITDLDNSPTSKGRVSSP